VKNAWGSTLSDPLESHAIILGQADIESQIQFLAQEKALSLNAVLMSQYRQAWYPHLRRIAECKSISGLTDKATAETVLSEAELRLFNTVKSLNIEADFLSDIRRTIDFENFPYLQACSIYAMGGFSGWGSLPLLEKLEITLKPRQMFDFDSISGAKDIQQLGIANYSHSDLGILEKFKNLKRLRIEPARKLVDVSKLKDLKQLQYIEIHEAPLVRDWSVLGSLTNLQCVSLVECKHARLPDTWAEHPMVANGNFWRTKVQFR